MKKGLRLKAFLSGADDVIEQPFPLLEIKAKLQRFLESPSETPPAQPEGASSN